MPGVPQNFQNAIDFYEDVVYDSSHPKGVLDLYRPANATGDTPCLLFIHGGSFISGDKDAVRRSAYVDTIKTCMQNGISVISMNYELAITPYDPKGLIRPMESARDGIAHIKKSANILQIDPDNMIFMGSSAGGFISQWLSMKEFGLIEGDPLLDVSLMPKAAVSFKPNLTMNLFRIEELGLLGDQTIDDVLKDEKFRENCSAWYGLPEFPNNRADLSVFPALQIMWKLDPIAQEMFTDKAKPLYLISTNSLEEPDVIEEYIHNPFNIQEIIDRYTNAGAEVYAWGLHPTNPTPNYPANRPNFYEWILNIFNN
jgi:acetyl esterase/lipase